MYAKQSFPRLKYKVDKFFLFYNCSVLRHSCWFIETIPETNKVFSSLWSTGHIS